MSIKTKEVLEKIDFVNRYRKLSLKYSFDLKESFKDYDNKKVIEIFDSLNIKIKFHKGDNFFKVFEIIDDYQFHFNIIIKHGIVELVLGVKKGDDLLPFGGSWTYIVVDLIGNDSNKIKLPIFRSYEELKEILSEAFSIYRDFKSELINK